MTGKTTLMVQDENGVWAASPDCTGLTKRQLAEYLAQELGLRLTAKPGKWVFEFECGPQGICSIASKGMTILEAFREAKACVEMRFPLSGTNAPYRLLKGPK